ncbi:TetR/AcrR family transcriptional regulator [Frankia sp. Cas3]|uniref:TetR/AcrR family transcriptional regulator n=1 Tax=Frankia sp. Cas3 TaxID=3073926 RepID=UPI002AD2E31F|nr:TetR/AcrR family transcriptional regulator [Frankia sp. Cas3]
MSPRGQGGRAPAAGSAAPSPDTHPGRPDKRRAIIDAARRVFLRNGFTDTSVDAIAAEAGVSKQTIYNHFGDKKSLFTAVIETAQRDAASEAESRFATEFTESGDLDRDLRAAARIWVELILAKNINALRRVIIAEQVRHPELGDEWARPRTVFEKVLAREIKQQVHNGVLEVRDVDLAAHQLVLLTAYEAAHQSRYGMRDLSPADIEKIVDDGVEMWLRCYRTRR